MWVWVRLALGIWRVQYTHFQARISTQHCQTLQFSRGHFRVKVLYLKCSQHQMFQVSCKSLLLPLLLHTRTLIHTQRVTHTQSHIESHRVTHSYTQSHAHSHTHKQSHIYTVTHINTVSHPYNHTHKHSLSQTHLQ